MAYGDSDYSNCDIRHVRYAINIIMIIIMNDVQTIIFIINIIIEYQII